MTLFIKDIHQMNLKCILIRLSQIGSKKVFMVFVSITTHANDWKCSMFLLYFKLSGILYWNVYYIFNRPDAADYITTNLYYTSFPILYVHIFNSLRHHAINKASVWFSWVVEWGEGYARQQAELEGCGCGAVGAKPQAELQEGVGPISSTTQLLPLWKYQRKFPNDWVSLLRNMVWWILSSTNPFGVLSIISMFYLLFTNLI